VRICALALVVLGACGEDAARRAMSQQRIEDRYSMRTIARLVIAGGKLPMKDGMFDPYALGRGNVLLFRSARYGFGPTEEEVKAGDYARFPWARCKGPRKLDGPPFPMLWEREPDRDGRMLCVRSDGIVAVWDPETLLRAVAEGPVER
jgi:hypothetical protein